MIITEDKIDEITDKKRMPFEMEPRGSTLNSPLLPPEWQWAEQMPVTYLQSRSELAFIINGLHGGKPKIMYNSLVFRDWKKDWGTVPISFNVKIFGIFLKESTIYAIGEDLPIKGKRVGRIFSYHQTPHGNPPRRFDDKVR